MAEAGLIAQVRYLRGKEKLRHATVTDVRALGVVARSIRAAATE
jgi:hypothetical protein